MNKVKSLILLLIVCSFINTNTSEHSDYEFVPDVYSGNSSESEEEKIELPRLLISEDICKLFKDDYKDALKKDMYFINKVINCLEMLCTIDTNYKFIRWNDESYTEIIELLEIDHFDSLQDICFALMSVFQKLEDIKKDHSNYHDLNIVNNIFIYSNRLINLIHKFKLADTKEFKEELLILNKTVKHIRQDMTKLALNKNKQALFLLRKNSINIPKELAKYLFKKAKKAKKLTLKKFNLKLSRFNI